MQAVMPPPKKEVGTVANSGDIAALLFRRQMERIVDCL